MEIPYLKSLTSLIEANNLNYEAFKLGMPESGHAGLLHDDKKFMLLSEINIKPTCR